MSDVLLIEDLAYSIRRRPVLTGLHLQVGRGEMVGLVGPNGSGKSTLLRCIAGIAQADRGDVRICGHSIRGELLLARAHLGYGVEPAVLPDELTGNDCLQIVAGARALAAVPAGTAQVAEALALTRWLDMPVGRYSFGTRQKLAITLALLGTPPLLVFDEALNGLDPVSALSFKNLLTALVRERGCSVLLATHSLELAERFLDRVVLLIEGSFAADWRQADLQRMRAGGIASVEAQVVAAIRAGHGEGDGLDP